MKPPSPRRRGPAAAAITLAAALASASACADRAPTAPEPAPATEAAAPTAADALAAERSGLAAAIEDARSRLLPGLSDRGKAEPLERALATLGAALVAKPEQVQRSASAARAALDAYSAAPNAESVADAPGLAAIRLVLDRLDAPEAR